MQPSVEFSITVVIFTLLVQLGAGIPLAGLFGGIGCGSADARTRMINQGLFALLFVCVAGFLGLVHPRLPLHSALRLIRPESAQLGREIALLFVTGLSLAGAVWLSRPPAHTALVKGLLATAALAGVVLIYVMSKVYDKPGFDSLESCATFFIFLASALILGGFWQGFALCLSMGERQIHRALWNLFFVSAIGFVLLAACAPISVPQPQGEGAFAIAQSVAIRQGLHTSLGGLGMLFFCCALWKSQQGKWGAPWMIAALVLGICGEIAGRSAFYLAYSSLGL